MICPEIFTLHGNYQLQSGSPCINVGDPSESYNNTDGSRNDMGAYGGNFPLGCKSGIYYILRGVSPSVGRVGVGVSYLGSTIKW